MTLLDEQIDEAFELFNKGFLTEAEALYNECLEKITDPNSNEYVHVLHGLGYVKAALKKYNEARSYYKELINIAVSNNDKTDHCIAIHQLGMVERMADCFEESSNLFLLEARLLKDYKIESPLNWAANFYEQGYVAFLMKDIELAQQLMSQSLQFALQSADDVCIACAYRGYGEIYNVKGETKLANQSFYKAKEYFLKANDELAIQEIEKLLI